MITKDDFLSGQLLLINKPLHWTSFQVVNKIRWLIKKHFQIKNIKVGHAGTLDPLATGLLLICTGKMTKQIAHLTTASKTYTGSITLGATTPSYDMETKINNTFATCHINDELLEKVRQKFTGHISQKPPIYSAIKKEGKRLYEHARAGESIEIRAREITIHELNFTSKKVPLLEFTTRCSKGTYIRSLAHDIGQALDSGAYLSKLCRTAIDTYQLTHAETIENFENRLNTYL